MGENRSKAYMDEGIKACLHPNSAVSLMQLTEQNMMMVGSNCKSMKETVLSRQNCDYDEFSLVPASYKTAQLSS